MVFADVAEQMDLIGKGAAEIVPIEALRERLAQGAAAGRPPLASGPAEE